MKNVLRQRFHPTPEQENLLARTFGCVRVAGNDAVEMIVEARSRIRQ